MATGMTPRAPRRRMPGAARASISSFSATVGGIPLLYVLLG
jgi:hypothetical protein